MRLNGKIYIREEPVLTALEDIIIILESGSYYQIADSIKNIKPENAESVASSLAEFQNMFIVYFKNENYRKLETIISMTSDNMYNPKKDKVSLFSQGAYGITVRADDDAVEKYVFNTCLHVFMLQLKKINKE